LSQTVRTGLILSLAGAILDFSSGYLFFAHSTTTTNDMGVSMVNHNSSAIYWGIGIVILGALLVITAIIGNSSVGMRRMSFFGTLMVPYGVLMVLIGASMYSNISPMMQGSLVLSGGMFLVGALMIVNGFWMRRGMSRKM
jgi:hypothetical protein